MTPPDSETRDRLLSKAGYAFAETGYRSTSLRSICGAAGANLSAVKYHFGSKEGLYEEVWRFAAAQMLVEQPIPEARPGQDPCERLAEFMAWFMRLVLTESEEHPWAGKLLAHESLEPTGALQIFVEQCAGPIWRELRAICGSIVDPGCDEALIEQLVNAVIALCVNPKHSMEILTHLGFPPPTTAAEIDAMASTLARFALFGLQGFAKGSTPC